MISKSYTLPSNKTISGMAHAVEKHLSSQENLTTRIIPGENSDFIIQAYRDNDAQNTIPRTVFVTPTSERTAKVAMVTGSLLTSATTNLFPPNPLVSLIYAVISISERRFFNKIHTAITAYLTGNGNAG